MLKFSVIIPTYNREKELNGLIGTVLRQTLKPDELIIIDDGELKENFISRIKEEIESQKIEFIYYKKDHSKERRGLSESKNIGLNLASNEIVFILDDDLGLKENFFKEIMKVWEKYKNDEKLVGVGGWIENLMIQKADLNCTLFRGIWKNLILYCPKLYVKHSLRGVYFAKLA